MTRTKKYESRLQPFLRRVGNGPHCGYLIATWIIFVSLFNAQGTAGRQLFIAMQFPPTCTKLTINCNC